MKYFRIVFHNLEDNTQQELFVKSKDMDRVELWVLKNRPMKDYYGMSICEVNADKTNKKGGDFSLVAVADYYKWAFDTEDDEVIRKGRMAQIIENYGKPPIVE